LLAGVNVRRRLLLLLLLLLVAVVMVVMKNTLSVCWRAGEAARQHQVGLAAPSQTNSWLAAVG
jgi:hypothetical protein